MADRWDAIVIGGGLAGLSAADALCAAGRRVLLLEAQDRVGGRTYTATSESTGSSVDLGGMWVGPTQTRMLALLERFGIEREPQYTDGSDVLFCGGVAKRFSGLIPPHSVGSLVELQLMLWRLDWMASRVSPLDPASAQGSSELGAQSVGAWAEGALWTAAAKETLQLAVGMVFGAHPDRISMLFFLSYVKAAGGLVQLLETRGAAQDSTLRGGAQQLSERLRGAVEAAGGEVRLGAQAERVVAVGPSGSLLGVECRGGGPTLRARAVVVALSPKVALESICFEPRLPERRRQLVGQLALGARRGAGEAMSRDQPRYAEVCRD